MIRPTSRRIAAAVLLIAAVQLADGVAMAYDLGAGGMGGDRTQGPSLTSEFIYRNENEEALIPVYLLGAVAKPGLYHIPADMDVLGLLTIAGGTQVDAQIDDILVRSQGQSSHPRMIRFNLNQVVRGGDAERVALVSNDLVYVTPGRPPVPFSTTLMTAIGIIAGVVGIIASGILISNAIK